MKLSSPYRGVFVFLVVLFSAYSAFAQVDTARLQGTVADPSGAAVTGAQVTVVNTATSRSTSATTNEFGYFTIPALLRSEEHTSELQSRLHLVCRLLLAKKTRPDRCRRVRVGRRDPRSPAADSSERPRSRCPRGSPERRCRCLGNRASPLRRCRRSARFRCPCHCPRGSRRPRSHVRRCNRGTWAGGCCP